MDRLDELLQRMAQDAGHPGLTRIDDAVLSQLGRRKQAAIQARALTAAAVVALVVGLSGAIIPNRAGQGGELALAAAPQLAPSILLAPGG